MSYIDSFPGRVCIRVLFCVLVSAILVVGSARAAGRATAGEFVAAEGYFREEIAIDPSLAAPYLYLGTTLRRLARNHEALPFLAQAVMRDRNYILAYNELATAQIQDGWLEDAQRTLRQGEERFPQSTAFPVQLASVLRRLGRTEEAKREAQKAALLNKSNQPPPPRIISGGDETPPSSDNKKKKVWAPYGQLARDS